MITLYVCGEVGVMDKRGNPVAVDWDWLVSTYDKLPVNVQADCWDEAFHRSRDGYDNVFASMFSLLKTLDELSSLTKEPKS